MKYTLLTSLVAVAIAVPAHASLTAGASNLLALSAAESPIYFDNTGTPTLMASGTGSVSVGIFNTLTDAQISGTLPNDASALTADFAGFGLTQNVQFTNAFALDGFFEMSSSALSVQPGSQFADKSVYVAIGNAATIAGSDQLAVFKFDTATFKSNTDDAANDTSGEALVSTGTGSLLYGGLMGSVTVDVFGTPTTFDNGILLAGAIPEPSSSLLLGFAGFALLARRKR